MSHCTESAAAAVAVVDAVPERQHCSCSPSAELVPRTVVAVGVVVVAMLFVAAAAVVGRSTRSSREWRRFERKVGRYSERTFVVAAAAERVRIELRTAEHSWDWRTTFDWMTNEF